MLERKGYYGRFSEQSFRGIELRNSLYHSGIWRDWGFRSSGSHMDYHGGTGCVVPVPGQKLKSGKSRKETADVGNSRFRTLQFL